MYDKDQKLFFINLVYDHICIQQIKVNYETFGYQAFNAKVTISVTRLLN